MTDPCRVCLTASADVPLFSNVADTKSSTELLKMLMECTAVMVRLEDPLPKRLCVACESRLRDAQRLKEQAQSSDRCLRRRYGLLHTEYPPHAYIATQFPPVKDIKQDIDNEDSSGLDEVCYSSELIIFEPEIKYVPPRTEIKAEKKSTDLQTRSTKTKTRRKPLTSIQGSKKAKVKLETKLEDDRHSEKELPVLESIQADESQTIVNGHSVEGVSTAGDNTKTKREPKFRKLGYECHICLEKFTEKKRYAKHMELEHQIFGLLIPRDHMCEVCGKVYSKQILKVHRLSHTNERPHTCNICGQNFSHKGNMTRHINRSHKKEKRFPCKVCSKSFFNSFRLKAHMLIHTGEKPHACHLCEWRFADRFALTRHIQAHSGKRPFGCKHCSQMYGQSNDLRRHVLRTHPDAPTEKLDDFCIKIIQELQ